MTGPLRVEGSLTLGEFELAVDLQVEPGEVLALLGPNGAGKSTLLRLVAGLAVLDSGSIRLGEDVLDDAEQRLALEPQQRRVGMVFQDHRLFPHLRVLDNVAFGPRSRGVARSQARAVAADWLARLGLSDLASRYPRQLSGGQAQRVALGRALAGEPRTLLLDEPLAALDVQTRAEVQGELREHLRSFAGPTVLVTHDPVEALLLADRIVVLEAGRIVQSGSPVEITARPLTPYAARLVGMNLLTGTSRGGVVAVDGGADVSVPGTIEGRVLVAIRPGAITVHLAEPGPSSARNRWPATVAALAPLGDRIRLTTRGASDLVVDVTAASVAELGLAPGTPVWLTAKAVDLDVYPEPAPAGLAG